MKYKVYITRETSETAIVFVNAASMDKAEAIAVDRENLEYTADDYAGTPYVSDCEVAE